MTTAAQVKRMVRPLLERNSDLALVGHWIYVKPVQHFARAILVDRTSKADRFSPRWAAIHLFEMRRSFTLNWGQFLVDPIPGRSGIWWPLDAPRIGDALCEAIEKQALPWLRMMSTLELFLAFVSQNLCRQQMYDKGASEIIMLVACGYLEAARKVCEKNLENWSVDKPHFDEEDKAKYRRLRELCACLMKDDKRGLVRLLHEWEALTVKNFKIEHLWEPTPFPLETQIAS